MKDAGQLQDLLEKVYQERGLDFRQYRPSTLTRRLSRRLRARGACSSLITTLLFVRL